VLSPSIGIVKRQAIRRPMRHEHSWSSRPVRSEMPKQGAHSPISGIGGVFIIPETESSWTTAYANKKTRSFVSEGTVDLSARGLFYFQRRRSNAGYGNSRVGSGIWYAFGHCLREMGREQRTRSDVLPKTYRLGLPPNVPRE